MFKALTRKLKNMIKSDNLQSHRPSYSAGPSLGHRPSYSASPPASHRPSFSASPAGGHRASYGTGTTLFTTEPIPNGLCDRYNTLPTFSFCHPTIQFLKLVTHTMKGDSSILNKLLCCHKL